MTSDSKHDSIGKCAHFHIKKFFDMHSNGDNPSDLYNYVINEVEKALITETMNYSNNIKSKATKILGINRNTLSKKIQELGLRYE